MGMVLNKIRRLYDSEKKASHHSDAKAKGLR